MPAFSYATFFAENGKKDFDEASHSLQFRIKRLPFAHSSIAYWASSLTYPIWHLVKAAVNAVQIVWGCCMFLGAIFYDPINSLTPIARGISNEITSLALNILNIAVSMIFLATGTLASILHETVGFGASGQEADDHLYQISTSM